MWFYQTFDHTLYHIISDSKRTQRLHLLYDGNLANFFSEAITGSRIYSVYCFVVNYLSIIKRSIDSLRVGFEPTLVEPIRFLVKRLKHSAIAADHIFRAKFWIHTRRHSIASTIQSLMNAASRIRTYAGRSHLISSQTP